MTPAVQRIISKMKRAISGTITRGIVRAIKTATDGSQIATIEILEGETRTVRISETFGVRSKPRITGNNTTAIVAAMGSNRDHAGAIKMEQQTPTPADITDSTDNYLLLKVNGTAEIFIHENNIKTTAEHITVEAQTLTINATQGLTIRASSTAPIRIQNGDGTDTRRVARVGDSVAHGRITSGSPDFQIT